MEPEERSPEGEAGAPERLISLSVDSKTIDRLYRASLLRVRVLCPDANFSMAPLLRRTDRPVESTEDETLELNLGKEEFDRLGIGGTLVKFMNGSKGALFTVLGRDCLFSSQSPLAEGVLKVLSLPGGTEWL